MHYKRYKKGVKAEKYQLSGMQPSRTNDSLQETGKHSSELSIVDWQPMNLANAAE
jgi:hypothetical protein